MNKANPYNTASELLIEFNSVEFAKKFCELHLEQFENLSDGLNNISQSLTMLNCGISTYTNPHRKHWKKVQEILNIEHP
jgi:hypothetical protein